LNQGKDYSLYQICNIESCTKNHNSGYEY
jgi:hypothetical protein